MGTHEMEDSLIKAAGKRRLPIGNHEIHKQHLLTPAFLESG
jgi:hypothetical protein